MEGGRSARPTQFKNRKRKAETRSGIRSLILLEVFLALLDHFIAERLEINHAPFLLVQRFKPGEELATRLKPIR